MRQECVRSAGCVLNCIPYNHKTWNFLGVRFWNVIYLRWHGGYKKTFISVLGSGIKGLVAYFCSE